jgi:BirA family biotin operon repressor/biotin-[acetyl-CoA-carboxylase] ligase
MNGWTIHRHDKLDSTMTEAARLAANGCPGRTAVVAAEQTAGQGRLGRSWHSEPGSGLYVSLILRAPFGAGAFPGLTLAIGLAAQDAILEATGVRCDLRWPNDLLIGALKCAGILVNLEERAVIAGIGINVNHAAFPPDLRDLATSLRIATGREHSRDAVLDQLLTSVDSYLELLATQGLEPILRLFNNASSYVTGRRVIVEQGSQELTGTTVGLDANGLLLVRQDNGKTTTILAGGVRPAN